MLATLDLIGSASAWIAFPLAAYVLARSASGTQLAPALRYALAASTVFAAAALAHHAVSTVRHIGEWDFACFWLYGHAALAHANVFDPATYHALAPSVPISFDDQFEREVLDVGFPYPPPSILLFAPLGLFHNFAAASGVWLLAMLGGLSAGIAILAHRREWLAALAIAALAIAMPATYDNVTLQQTSLLAFALVAGAYAGRRSYWGGAFAALAFVVKPYLIVAVVWLALRRHGHAFAASILTLVAITAASLPLIGPGALATYASNNPIVRLPPSVLSEYWAASLYSLFLHVPGAAAPTSAAAPFHSGIYLACSALLAALTCWFVVKVPRERDDLALGLLLMLGLLIYPATSSTYAVVLVIALLAIARATHGDRSRAFLFALYALGFYASNANAGFPTSILFVATWCVLIVAAATAPRFAAVRDP